MTKKLCIVCGKPIRKRTSTIYFKEPTKHRENTVPWGGLRWTTPERPDGHREVAHGMTTLYLSDRPRTKEEAQRHVNQPIMAIRKWGGFVSHATFWDGESYESDFFHSQECAARQGYASARQGDRYVWK